MIVSKTKKARKFPKEWMDVDRKETTFAPYRKENFLTETHIAGTSHIKKIEKREPKLERGKKLVLKRESYNPYDFWAIRVETKKGKKLGYIPKKDNEILARLMDMGIPLYGRIDWKEYKGDWLFGRISIYVKRKK